MVPNGGLTDWQVKVMINDAIDIYDGINSRRHEEHNKKLDRLMWAILGTLATACGALILNIVHLAIGK